MRRSVLPDSSSVHDPCHEPCYPARSDGVTPIPAAFQPVRVHRLLSIDAGELPTGMRRYEHGIQVIDQWNIRAQDRITGRQPPHERTLPLNDPGHARIDRGEFYNVVE
jgi:hypothetical protein